MYSKLLDWCISQPNWIGFPIWLAASVVLPTILLLAILTISPWMLLTVPVIWLIAVAIHYSKKGK